MFVPPISAVWYSGLQYIEAMAALLRSLARRVGARRVRGGCGTQDYIKERFTTLG
jgi:hypothetical protein